MALLLLEIPGVSQRYGMFVPPPTPDPGLPGKLVEPYPTVDITQGESAGDPAVFTLTSPGLTSNGLSGDEQVFFLSSDDKTKPLPPEIQPWPKPNNIYYVLPTGLTPDSFQISATSVVRQLRPLQVGRASVA